jgi:type I restriction enzyme S subunit
MKKGWEIKTLGEICEVLDSKRKPITKRDRTAGEYPYYGATGILDYVHEYIFNEKLVLIGEDGAKWESGEWTAFIAEGKYWVNNHAHVIRPNRSIILDNWIVYFLYFSDLHKYVTGLTVPKLNQEKMRSITLPIPPLPEQQRIVSVLDEAFASIAQAKSNAERNLVNARELFWSVLQSSMSNDGWDKKTLKEISITFGRGKSKNRPRNDPKLYGGKYPFIQTGDIRNSNHYITEYTQTYNEVGLAQSKLWKKGTICITIAANIAETGILGFDACFPDSVIGLEVDPKIADTDFIEYLLQSFRARLQAKGKGSAQDNLNMEKFENEYFPIPPLAEQRAIVGRLEALSAETGRLEEIYQQKVESLEELKKSVLGKAFSGDL